jgi:thymidylate synthase
MVLNFVFHSNDGFYCMRSTHPAQPKISEDVMNHFGKQIIAHSLVDGWTRYVSYVYGGTMGVDDSKPIREQFLVIVHFKPGADFDAVHPAMDIARQTQYVKKILTTELDKELGGSYGYRIRKTYGIDQLKAAVGQLVKRHYSKSAIINTLHPRGWEGEVKAGMKRMVCLNNIQALIRDGQLHFVAQFRSQNAWNSHGNFKGLYELQRLMLSRLEERGLKVNRGGFTVIIAAAHLYEPDFNGAEQISKEVQASARLKPCTKIAKRQRVL